MFAIDPLSNQGFYQSYGLYLRQHDTREGRKKKTKMRELNMLQLQEMAELHGLLYRHAQRRSGVIANPQLYASMINSGNIVFETDKALPAKVVNSVKLSGMKLVVSKPKVKAVVSQTDHTELETDLDLDLVKDLSDATRRIFSQGTGVPIIIFNDDRYRVNIPKYMAQIMVHAQVYSVPMFMSRVDSGDLYLRRYFKIINHVVSELQLKGLKLNSSTDAIANYTPYPNGYLIRKYQLSDFQFIALDGMQITFTGIYGPPITIRSNYSFGASDIRIGMSYLECYHQLIRTSRPAFYDTPGLSRTSTVVSKTRDVLFQPRLSAMAVLTKFVNNVLDPTQRRVLLVVMANKGSGKTGILTHFCELFKAKYAQDIGHLSSDAFGRWRYTIEQQYDLSKEKVPPPTYNELVKLDVDDVPSIYEVQALKILNEAGVLTAQQYTRLSTRAKSKLIKTFIEYFTTFLLPDTEYGETFFHDAIQTAADAPRVMVFEAHTLSQDAVLGRTNSTILLETINDTTLAVLERDRGGIEQLLLHDAYYTLLGNPHTSVFPWELLLAVK